jgi:hypothetical protein
VELKKNKQFTAYYPKTAKNPSLGINAKNTGLRIIQRQTPEQAQAMAEKIYRDVVLHELKFSRSTSGDNLANATHAGQDRRTQSLYDQNYWCDSVRRRMDWDSGYTMYITGKNHSPALEITTE